MHQMNGILPSSCHTTTLAGEELLVLSYNARMTMSADWQTYLVLNHKNICCLFHRQIYAYYFKEKCHQPLVKVNTSITLSPFPASISSSVFIFSLAKMFQTLQVLVKDVPFFLFKWDCPQSLGVNSGRFLIKTNIVLLQVFSFSSCLNSHKSSFPQRQLKRKIMTGA